MEVQAWNHQAEELWGLRASEVMGHHFLNLDIGFPVDRLRPAIRDTLSGRHGRQQVVQPAINRRGKHVECTVNITSMVSNGNTNGVILMMDTNALVPAADSSDGTDAATKRPESSEEGRLEG
jgi:two-component system CheB/CheR fusion protein